MPAPPSILLIGCGLIGGSIGLAAKRSGAGVVGVDRPEVLASARALGVIDAGHPMPDLAAAMTRGMTSGMTSGNPDVVVLALPLVELIDALGPLAAIASTMDTPPLVLDVGSVKQPVLHAAETVGCPRFVGGHPMAGRERSGIANAAADLLHGRPFVLCPSKSAGSEDLAQAIALVTNWGAVPTVMDAALHDRCVAMVSHLPHLAAFALMASACRMEGDLAATLGSRDLPLGLAAGAWRDATRVAASPIALWRSIIALNHEAVLERLDAWMETLQHLRAALVRDPSTALDELGAEDLAERRRELDRVLP